MQGVLKWFIIVTLLAALAVLVGEVYPARIHTPICRETLEQCDLQNIVISIKDYQVEYNRLPTDDFQGGGEKPLACSGALLKSLLRFGDASLNPRGIGFIEAKRAGTRRSGITGPPESPTFVDRWGQPYQIVLDLNGDGKIPNPARGTRVSKNGDEMEPDVLELEVIAFSSGPDGNPNTWEDNAKSWR
jgi:hypothetical protein